MRFDSYHPTINLLYFVAVIGCTVWFRHPIFLALSFCCAFAYSVKLRGARALVFNLCLIPCAAGFALWFAGYSHFGVTNLRQNFIGNQITLESLAYGAALGVCAAAVVMWMSCVHAVFTADKTVYLFGRISPRLSLFLAILLRMVPRIKQTARRINTAQSAIGRGAGQGSVLRRLCNGVRIFSAVVTWTIEAFVTSADSMRSRGYALRGRTAFSIYRFDNRDRAFVVALSACMTVILMGVMFEQTNILYNPRIVFNRITPLSAVFYAGYAVFCLLPMGLQLAGEARFKRLRCRAEEAAGADGPPQPAEKSVGTCLPTDETQSILPGDH